MSISIGLFLSLIGLIGSALVWSSISSDYIYTYTPPFTSHEMMMIFFLILFVAMFIVGIYFIVSVHNKKRNEDQLNRLTHTGNNVAQKDVCPKCGLNIAKGVSVCPRCGTKREEP